VQAGKNFIAILLYVMTVYPVEPDLLTGPGDLSARVIEEKRAG
jgi:hypothetical protein